MATKLIVPKFANDTEESEWWYAHREDVNEEIVEAFEQGRMKPSKLMQRGNTPTTTIRLDPADIAKARDVAGRKGLPYQTYLKSLIHEALERETAA